MAAAALLAPAAARADAPCRISEVREELLGGTAHLIVVGVRDFDYVSPGARSVVIELPGCRPAFDASTLRFSSPLIVSSRVTVSEGPDKTALTLELRPGATYRLFSADAGVHLVVEGPEVGEAPTAAPEPAIEPTYAPLPEATRVVEAETPRPTAVPEPTRMVEVEIETPPATVAPVPTIAPTEEPSPAVASATLAPTTAPERTAAPAAPIASVEPVIEPAAPAAVDGPATRIVAMRAEQRAGEIVITIDADGRIESYRDFRVPDPERVAVDFRGLTIASRVVAPTLPNGALHVRAAQFKRSPPIARVVLDVATRVAYRVTAEGRSLAIIVTTD
jgi:hypothetical protein